MCLGTAMLVAFNTVQGKPFILVDDKAPTSFTITPTSAYDRRAR